MEPAEPQGLLAKLSEADQAGLIQLGSVRRYAPGDFLCRQGDIGTFAVLISAGTVKVQMSAADGSTTLLGLCGSGDLIGELSGIRGEGTPREATVQAINKVTSWIIDHERFRRLLNDRPRIQHAVTLLQIDRMRQSAKNKLHSAAHPIALRVARVLTDLVDQHGRPCNEGTAIDLALSQQDLADLVGGSRESVVRAIGDLRDRLIIQTGRQQVIVCDMAALQSIAAAID